MSYVPDQAGFDPASSAAQAPADLDRHPLSPLLELLIDALADGQDHPEIWAQLADPERSVEQVELFWLIDARHPGESDPLARRALVLIATMIHTLWGDRTDGLALLDALVAGNPGDAQIASAARFLRGN